MRKELNRKKILIKVKVKPVKSKEFDNVNLNKKVNMSYVNALTESINQKFHN